MTNAIIRKAVLAFESGVPYISFSFAIRNTDPNAQPTITTASTNSIYLISPNENLTQSSAAYVLALLFDVIGVQSWDDIVNKAVQVELDDNGNVIKIANVLDETLFAAFSAPAVDAAAEDNAPTEVTE